MRPVLEMSHPSNEQTVGEKNNISFVIARPLRVKCAVQADFDPRLGNSENDFADRIFIAPYCIFFLFVRCCSFNYLVSPDR